MRRRERLIVAAGILGLLAAWEALVRSGRLDASLAPAPSTIQALVRLLRRPEVLTSLAVTAWEVLAAFLVAVPVGLSIGFALAEVPILSALFRPLVNFLFGVPKSIFLPVFILVFGVSVPQKIAFGVFTTIFVLDHGRDRRGAVRAPRAVTVSRVYGASRGQIIREIYLPAMAPILLESVRLAMVFNITAVLLCEIYGARDGIGYRIAAWGENRPDAPALRRPRDRGGGGGGRERGAARGRDPARRVETARVTRALVAIRCVSQRFGVDGASVAALDVDRPRDSRRPVRRHGGSERVRQVHAALARGGAPASLERHRALRRRADHRADAEKGRHDLPGGQPPALAVRRSTTSRSRSSCAACRRPSASPRPPACWS